MEFYIRERSLTLIESFIPKINIFDEVVQEKMIGNNIFFRDSQKPVSFQPDRIEKNDEKKFYFFDVRYP